MGYIYIRTSLTCMLNRTYILIECECDHMDLLPGGYISVDRDHIRQKLVFLMKTLLDYHKNE